MKQMNLMEDDIGVKLFIRTHPNCKIKIVPFENNHSKTLATLTSEDKIMI